MAQFFVRFEATRNLDESEMIGVMKALVLLREERAILGWRLAHEVHSTPRISLELEAESDTHAVVNGNMVFVEVLAGANLEGQRDVFTPGQVVWRAAVPAR